MYIQPVLLAIILGVPPTHQDLCGNFKIAYCCVCFIVREVAYDPFPIANSERCVGQWYSVGIKKPDFVGPKEALARGSSRNAIVETASEGFVERSEMVTPLGPWSKSLLSIAKEPLSTFGRCFSSPRARPFLGRDPYFRTEQKDNYSTV